MGPRAGVESSVVTELSPGQKALLAERVAHWRGVAYSTEPADRARAEAGVRKLYRIVGAPEPREFLWAGSPAGMPGALEAAGHPVRVEDLEANLQVPPRIDQGLWPEHPFFSGQGVSGGVDAEIIKAFGPFDRTQPIDLVWGAAEWIPGHMMSFWEDLMFGQDSALSFGVEEFERMVSRPGPPDEHWDALAQIQESSGWWIPGREVVVMAERRSGCRIEFDQEGRLHREDGPLVEYPDGWGAYVLHGVSVPREVVMAPETVPAERIRDEPNLEVRRLMIERWAGRGTTPAQGWRRYLDAAGAVVLDQRRNDAEATTETLVTTMDHTVLLCGCPSTGRVYALEVAPQVATCEQAQDWLSGGLAGRVISAA